MQDIRQQLEALGRRGRGMLVLQRLLQWSAVVIAAAFALALVDYTLRLPGVARLLIGAFAAATAGVWVVRRTWRAAAFRPDVSELALRAERVYPHLRGLLTAAVELAAAGGDASPQQRALAEASVERARRAVSGVELRRLLDSTQTWRRLALFAVAAAALVLSILLAPDTTATAASRWLKPLGETQWPRRVEVALGAVPQVLPVDAAIPVQATVERGDRAGLNVRLAYRFVGPDGAVGPWQYALMSRLRPRAANGATPAGHGVFEAVIDPPASLSRRLKRGGQDAEAARLELRVSAGDDRTQAVSARLAARPAVRSVEATVTPPAYAAGLLDPRRVDLFGPASIAAISAQAGSTVALKVRFNKPIDPHALPGPGHHLPGLRGAPGFAATLPTEGDPASLAAIFELRDDRQTTLDAVDRHGLALVEDRVYRFEASPDTLPSAAVTAPAADLSVLPTAVIPVTAVGRDDLGLLSLVLRSAVTRAADAPPPAAGVGEPPLAAEPIVLARETGRRAAFELDHVLDLATLGVEPGDEVALTAVVTDVFELDGETHDPVVSTPRRLRIIDEAGLMDQVRSDLAALRQRAVRMEQTQRRLAETPAELAGPRQGELTRRIEAARDTLTELTDRLDLNRLPAQAVRELIHSAGARVDAATAASRAAASTLNDPQATDAEQAEARARQEQSRRELGELVDMLDQGADALSLRLKLDRLRALQEAVAEETRRLLPRTVGRDAEQLDPELREALEDLARRQAELAEQAAQTTRRLQSTAAALSRQSESDRDQATAEALAEAAAVARRQGLDQAMEDARQAIEGNRLSSAGGDQQQALEVLEEMLEQVGSQQRRMREMLRRRLTELVERLERLIERQEGELARLQEVAVAADPAAFARLAENQAQLRRSTMAAELDAAKSEETAGAADAIAAAVADQAQAVLALRGSDSAGADAAERSALASLREALEQIREAQAEQQQDDTTRQRDELRKAYDALADRQDALRQAVAELAGEARLTRRQRASLLERGAEQEEIRTEAAALGEQAGETLVFEATHARIDADAEFAGRALRRAVADAQTLSAQSRVARMLSRMGEALDLQPPPEDFEGRQAGDGGGGSGQPPPLVPPLAELKLLRSLQSDILTETRAIADGPADDEAVRRRLSGLSTRQRELARLGERLIEQMQQQTQQPGVMPPEGDQP